MLRGDIAEGLDARGRFNPAKAVCFFFKAGTLSAGLGANRSNRKIGGVNEILDLKVLKAHVEARRFAKYWQILLEMVNIFEKNVAVGTTPRDRRRCEAHIPNHFLPWKFPLGFRENGDFGCKCDAMRC